MKAYNAIVLREAINDVYFEDTGKKLVKFSLNERMNGGNKSAS